MAAHSSGNPTWVDYPSTATMITATSLENIEGLLDTHQTKLTNLNGSASYSSPPICDVRLTSNFSFGSTGAGSDAFGTNNWSVSSSYGGTDPFGMATISSSSGTNSYITLPVGGRWYVHLHLAVMTTGNGLVNGRITLNAASDSSSVAVGTQVPFGTGTTPEIGIDAFRERVFSAGDKLYWAAYGQLSAANAATAETTLNGVPTGLIVRYLGPN